MVRVRAATEKKIASELGDRLNIHIHTTDLTNYVTLKQAATETARIVGNQGVDYLVANGALLPFFDQFNHTGTI